MRVKQLIVTTILTMAATMVVFAFWVSRDSILGASVCAYIFGLQTEILIRQVYILGEMWEREDEAANINKKEKP